MSFTFIKGGRTYKGATAYIRIIFNKVGLFIAIYILIGVFYNTASPHFLDRLGLREQRTCSNNTSSGLY